MRLLIKYPTRRHDRCVEILKSYVCMAHDMSNIQIIVSIDEDDTKTIEVMDDILSIHQNVKVCLGESNGKIDAINRDIPPTDSFDILLLISDDMIPQISGYDQTIINDMNKYYPDRDGVLFYNDGYMTNKLNTLVILGVNYYNRFNYIYCPQYKSFWCDNEFMDVAYELDKQQYIDNVIIKHEHPLWNVNINYDQLYQKNDVYFEEDKQTYYTRSKTILSILICTIPSRETMLRDLLQRIETLARKANIKIEIITDDKMGYSVGVKRNKLLNLATSKYCCFIDDDDNITDDYFTAIASALRCDYDCIQLNGHYYTNGSYSKPFYHSIKYNEWSETSHAYLRYPNHLNIIKTEIVRQISFTDKMHGEDYDFSRKLYHSNLIKTEYKHDTIQYLYMYVEKPSILSSNNINKSNLIINSQPKLHNRFKMRFQG